MIFRICLYVYLTKQNVGLEIKNVSGLLQYVNGCLSKRQYYNSKLVLVKCAQEAIIGHFEYKLKLEFNDSALVVKSNSYLTKVVNAYIVYNLDASKKKIT